MKNFPHEPIGERLLVKRDPVPEKKGLIEIPQTAREPPRTATVIAVGSSCERLEAGDRVMIAYGSGTPIVLDGETYDLILPKHVFLREKKKQ